MPQWIQNDWHGKKVNDRVSTRLQHAYGHTENANDNAAWRWWIIMLEKGMQNDEWSILPF